MKKNLFWKIMTILFFLWLCLWLWNSSIVIQHAPAGSLKYNKLTGSVYKLIDTGWHRIGTETDK